MSNYLQSVSFEENVSSLVIGTINGYKIIRLDSNAEPELIHEGVIAGGVKCISRVCKSQFIIYVKRRTPNVFEIYHYGKDDMFLVQSYDEEIQTFLQNRGHIVVCFANRAIIYSTQFLKPINILYGLPDNYYLTCKLSVTGELALPDMPKAGQISLYDCCRNGYRNTTIRAHERPLAALGFNKDGSLLATADENGIDIKVWEMRSGNELFHFKRGAWTASINCLAFNRQSLYSCLTSDTKTVHLFKLTNEDSGNWFQMFMLGNARDSLVKAYLPQNGLRSYCDIGEQNGNHRLFVVSSDRKLRIFSFDEQNGGTAICNHTVDF
ncbi:WD repeat domain phosphoinositide-interacting protein 2-like protein [Leptotrombidium deliense]|uniref:WD repeat domain phosphoinositide-interacting protein 2-like protein n=1 Tax=Leptotrombidium deliense TaxID=299467 RepID=A0A443S2W1_9ACAR|nr:WD repeat domain phosphoinositide-interacting protein 2-like protein [Leptotrombidium deliense]